jgi:diadenosine tetraphosphate (Ap4A) HIT family hydrolase
MGRALPKLGHGMELHWPTNWAALVSGRECPMCAEGGPDRTTDSVRFFRGHVADAYLATTDVQRGYTIVIWSGRHVTDLADLSPDELARYSSEVVAVARAARCLPAEEDEHLTLGNWVPHLHTHLIPRYVSLAAGGGGGRT